MPPKLFPIEIKSTAVHNCPIPDIEHSMPILFAVCPEVTAYISLTLPFLPYLPYLMSVSPRRHCLGNDLTSHYCPGCYLCYFPYTDPRPICPKHGGRSRQGHCSGKVKVVSCFPVRSHVCRLCASSVSYCLCHLLTGPGKNNTTR